MLARSLDEFVDALEPTLDHGEYSAKSLERARSSLTEALRSPAFIMDIVGRVLDSIAAGGDDWRNPPLAIRPDRGLRVHAIYWPPKFANPPHRHDTWTLAGVFYNRLNITTYRTDRQTAEAPGVERQIEAHCGEVGYLRPPCIHSFSNPTARPAASLHIFSSAQPLNPLPERSGSERKTTPSTGPVGPSGKPAARALSTNVAILSQWVDPGVFALLDRSFQMGDPNVKLAAVKAMCRLDPSRGARRLESLASTCTCVGADQDRLRQIRDALLSALDERGLRA